MIAMAAAPAVAEARSLTLDGPGATRRGHQVTLTGRLNPAKHRVRLGLYLGSSVVAWTYTNENGFFVVRPNLYTAGAYRARARGVISPPHRVEIRRRMLDGGERGPDVMALVRRLDSLGYAVADRETTRFTGSVRQTVYAFQKAQGLTVDGVVGPLTRAQLRNPQPLEPRNSEPDDHIEVDKARQLLLVIRNGKVERIINASTAGVPGYHTPEGRFQVFRRVEGIDVGPLGRLWNPLYFRPGGYAIHGSTSVPPVPASHGCVRIPLWEARRLFKSVPYGRVVYVY